MSDKPYATITAIYKVEVQIHVHKGKLKKHTLESLVELNIPETIQNELELTPHRRYSGNFFYRPDTLCILESSKVTMHSEVDDE